jgi:hypothetical protein
MAAAGVPEHERHIMVGVHLEDAGHPLPAAGAVGVIDVLNPGGLAGELVAEFAVGDVLGQHAVPDVVEHRAQLRAR